MTDDNKEALKRVRKEQAEKRHKKEDSSKEHVVSVTKKKKKKDKKDKKDRKDKKDKKKKHKSKHDDKKSASKEHKDKDHKDKDKSEAHHKSKKHKKESEKSHASYMIQGRLHPGFILSSKGGTQYAVEAVMTDKVYAVRNKTTDRLYAMKIEWKANENDPAQLKRDVFVLLDAMKHKKRFNRHFTKLHTKGKIPDMLNYVLMSLCDYNLDDLRTHVLDGCDFSQPNAARLCMQSFQAVHDLHSMGYIHRQINPTKFVFGLSNPHLIYIVGFSLAYHFEQRYDIKASLDSPRKLPKFKERVFLPRSYHRNKEFTRKDDLEAWIYLCFNLFGRKILPWNEQFNDLNMLVNKERLFADEFDEVYKFVPHQFKTIMHNLDKMDEHARPDYTFIGMILVTIKETIKFNFYGPFDWQKDDKDAGAASEKQEGDLQIGSGREEKKTEKEPEKPPSPEKPTPKSEKPEEKPPAAKPKKKKSKEPVEKVEKDDGEDEMKFTNPAKISVGKHKKKKKRDKDDDDESVTTTPTPKLDKHHKKKATKDDDSDSSSTDSQKMF